MKKIIVLALCVALSLVVSVPAFAIELTPDAAQNVPSNYAVVKDGTVVYDNSPSAYSPKTFNAIMEAYGLDLTAGDVAAADIPPTYAKVVDGEVVFGNSPSAYRPSDLHKILMAYGLTLSPQAVENLLGGTNYAKVVDGEVVFGKSPSAYSGKTLSTILAAYTMPQVAVVEEEVEVEIVDRDSDGDGVVDRLDRCPNTPMGTEVDEFGCPIEEEVVVVPPVDTDQDGIEDARDVCPGTPAGANIDERGCWVLSQDYLFDFDKATIKPQYYSMLDDVVRIIRQNPDLRVEIQGHTDSIGSEAYNMDLSRRRANAVKTYLVNQGISSARLTTVGYGESRPVATNATKEGRAKNRRVELQPIW